MISYHLEGVEKPKICTRRTSKWVKDVAEKHGKIVGEIAYIFCCDEYIIDVNRKFLNHDYYTDVITFDYSEGKKISGDIFISLDTVRTNAEAFNQDYPFLNLYRLTFDGNTYTLSFTDSGVEYTRTFEYLMKYEASGTPLVGNTEHKRIVHYALTHDTTHTWEELWGSLASSASPAVIDFYPIYAER